MTRSPRDPRPVTGGPRDARSARGPRGPMTSGLPLAAVLSVVGLAIVALGTFALGSGDLPLPIGGGNRNPGSSGGTGGNGVVHTPTPSGVVVVPSAAPGIKVPGTLLYAKDGNIWLESRGQATQLTSTGNDSMPSFSSDGNNILFVRTRFVRGLWNNGVGGMSYYNMNVPAVMVMPTAGGNASMVLDGNYNPPGRGNWMAWLREPVLAPNGHTIALLTDLPSPGNLDVTLKLYDTGTKKLTDLKLAEVAPLGHQDPAWRPDGKLLAYVYNNRDGANGAPQIYAYNVSTNKTRAISGPGYLHPSWSPDGQYLAVTKTSAYGTDVAILNATSGAEVTLLTHDGASWAPVWSPAGDQIAFLHANGQVVDLRLVTLKGNSGDWTAGDSVDLTQNAGLDSISRPDWFVPANQMPAATPAPAGSPAASASGSAASPSPS